MGFNDMVTQGNKASADMFYEVVWENSAAP